MPWLRFSASSRADLAEIWERIAADSPRTANAVHERLHLKCAQLMTQPLAGHRRDDVKRGLRSLSSDGYVIFYRYVADEVRVSRVVHHSRHLPALSFDEKL